MSADQPPNGAFTLSPDHFELFRELAAREGVTVAPLGPTIGRTGARDRYPLSFAQERLWFLDQLRSGRAEYNLPGAVVLPGPVSPELVRRAVDATVRRHEILRTTFRSLRGVPSQQVHSAAPGDLVVTDLRGRPDTSRALDDLLDAEARLPFDLAAGPLVRFRLILLDGERNVLFVNTHHIVCDGESLRILFHEIAENYAALSEGREPAQPELPVQYGDFAVWQRETANGAAGAANLDWWATRLKDVPVVLDLPAAKPRPRHWTGRGRRHTFTIGPALTSALREVVRRDEATVFSVLLAAFEVHLGRLSGRQDFVVGCPVGTRKPAELESLVGDFVNTLPVRSDLAGAGTFDDLVRRVRDSVAGALDHDEVPFDRLVQALAVPRDPSRAPLFQVALAFQGGFDRPDGASGAELLEIDDGTAKFDLTLWVADRGADLAAAFEYPIDLFDAAVVRGWVESFLDLLARLLSDPRAAVAEVVGSGPLSVAAARSEPVRLAARAPGEGTERLLASVWQEVLSTEVPDVHQTFFDLGGDSILAVRMVAMAGERGLDLTVADLYEHQTIAALAALDVRPASVTRPARSRPMEGLSEADVAALPDGVEDAYPLTRLQAAMLVGYADQDYPAYHNVTAIPVLGRFDHEALQRAVDEVVARHPVLRTSFDLTGYSEPIQLVHRDVRTPVEVHDLRVLPAQRQRAEHEAWMTRQYRTGLPLTTPGLLRLHVHRFGDTAMSLTAVECHAILDGWSFTSTVAEILRRYGDLLENGHSEPEAPPAVPFRDFVLAEREVLSSDAARKFWNATLAGAVPPHLPTLPARCASPRADVPVHRREVTFTADLSARVTGLASRLGVPVKSVLLAAHAAVLGTLCDTDDVVSGLVCNGRFESAEGEQTRGLFLNTLPVRLRLDGRDWRHLIVDAFAVEQRLQAFRRYPGVALEIERGGPGLTHIAFNYTNFHSLRDGHRPGVVEFAGKFSEKAHTDFALHVNFDHVDLGDSAEIMLLMMAAPGSLSAAQADLLPRLYENALAAAVEDPAAEVGAVSLYPADCVPALSPDPSGAATRLSADATSRAAALLAGTASEGIPELASAAERIAALLTTRRIESGAVVAIHCGHNGTAAAAALGVLKAGASCVWPSHGAVDSGYVPPAGVELCLIDEATTHAEPLGVDTLAVERVRIPGLRPAPDGGIGCVVLDRRGHAVPDGVFGELHLAGATLHRVGLRARRLPDGTVMPLASPAVPARSIARRSGPTPPRTGIERILVEVWTTVLGRDDFGVDDHFRELGGDSLLTLHVVAKARRQGVHLRPADLLVDPTIAELALAAREAADPAPVPEASAGAAGSIPLTPVQRWFLDLDKGPARPMDQTILFQVHGELSEDLLAEAVAAVIDKHEALRLEFTHDGRRWHQRVGPPRPTAVVGVLDLSGLDRRAQDATLQAEVGRIQAGWDVAVGPQLAVRAVRRGPDRPPAVLFVAHHLVVDGVSWRVIWDDLYLAVDQLTRGTPVLLPPVTTSFADWAGLLQGYVGQPWLSAQRGYWRDVIDGGTIAVPVDHHQGPADYYSAGTTVVRMDADETRALFRRLPEVAPDGFIGILLAAISDALRPWTGAGDLLVNLLHHGRTAPRGEVDVTRTVGWFTAPFPFALPLPRSGAPALADVLDRLAAVPDNGIGYGILRYLGENATLAVTPQITINYNGLIGADLLASAESRADRAEVQADPIEADLVPPNDAIFPELLYIAGGVTAAGLHISFRYSKNRHRPATVESLAERVLAGVRDLLRAPDGPEPDVPDPTTER